MCGHCCVLRGCFCRRAKYLLDGARHVMNNLDLYLLDGAHHVMDNLDLYLLDGAHHVMDNLDL